MKVASLEKLTNHSAQAAPLSTCTDPATVYKAGCSSRHWLRVLVAEVRQAEVIANRDCRQSKSTTKRDYGGANPPVNEVLLAICFKLAVYG